MAQSHILLDYMYSYGVIIGYLCEDNYYMGVSKTLDVSAYSTESFLVK